MESIDEFCSDQAYPEFKMSKPAIEIEADYLQWGKSVAELYYGQRVDINTNDGRSAMKMALDMLNKGAPDIVEKCKVSGVPVERLILLKNVKFQVFQWNQMKM